MKFQIKLTGILFLLSFTNSCCPFASNEIQSVIHEDSYPWFSVYENDSRLYESKFIRHWADSTVIFIDTTTYSKYSFISGACNGECSPTCEVVECRDNALNLNGEEDLLIFNIPCFQIDRSFDFTIDNKGEVIDSLEVFENGWEQDLIFTKKDTIEFNGNVFENCFEIKYIESIITRINRFNVIYCKNEGVIIKEEVNESYDVDQNQILLITDTTTIL